MIARLALPLLICAGFAGSSAWAAGPQGAGVSPFSREADIEVLVAKEGHIAVTRKEVVVLGSPAAARMFARQVVPINRRNAEASITDALLRRKDGGLTPLRVRRLEDAFEIIAPEAAEGDSIAYTLTLADKPGMAGASYIHRFPAHGRWGKVSVSVRAAEGVPLHHTARGLTSVLGKGRVDWSAKDLPFVAAEPNQVDPLDTDPYFAISTFADDTAIARAMHARNLPDGADAEVKRIAGTLAGADAPPQAVVAAAYRWLTSNLALLPAGLDETVISGMGGGSSPSVRDILSRGQGTALDLARVYRSLLAARNVPSDMVLANRRAIYSAPKFAHAHFDHVLVHIPGLNLFVDPSRLGGGLGDLSGEMAGKDILIINANAARRVTLDSSSIGIPKVVVDADLRVSPQGDISGDVLTEAYGAAKSLARLQVRTAANEPDGAYERKLLSRQNIHGQVSVVFATQEQVDSPLRINANLLIYPPREKDRSVRPIINSGPRFIRSANFPIAEALRTDRKRAFVCEAQHFIQRIRLKLPPHAEPIQLPRDVNAKAEFATYRAEYKVEFGVLIAERELVLTPPSAACSPDLAKSVAHVMFAASQDSHARLIMRGAED